MDNGEHTRLRDDLIEIGRWLDKRQLIAGTEGNLSVQLDDGSVLITRSGCMLGRLQSDDFVQVRVADGAVASGDGRPTSELNAHLVIYHHDDKAGAVVHAHPRSCVAITLRGWSLKAVPVPEAAYALGSVPTCDFAVPGSDEGGEVVKPWAGKRDAFLLDRHGAIAVGANPFDAHARMEMLDSVAQMVLLAGGPSQMKPLARADAERVAEMAINAGAREDSVRAWLDGLPD